MTKLFSQQYGARKLRFEIETPKKQGFIRTTQGQAHQILVSITEKLCQRKINCGGQKPDTEASGDRQASLTDYFST